MRSYFQELLIHIMQPTSRQFRTKRACKSIRRHSIMFLYQTSQAPTQILWFTKLQRLLMTLIQMLQPFSLMVLDQVWLSLWINGRVSLQSASYTETRIPQVNPMDVPRFLLSQMETLMQVFVQHGHFHATVIALVSLISQIFVITTTGYQGLNQIWLS